MNVNILLQKALPQHTCSKIVGRITRSEREWLKNLLIKSFIKNYNVNMQLADEPDYRLYPSFNEFFTRKLKSNIRPIAKGEQDIACPVDGRVSELGQITKNRLFQAKGLDYSLKDLLAGNENLTAQFNGGYFSTFYLSPSDYHRVHLPFSGQLISMTHVPGKLFSVSPYNVNNIPKLFARNERVICLFETRLGLMAVILVGAILVGSISTVWAGTVNPEHSLRLQLSEKQYAKEGPHSLKLTKGMELGHFNMGSTVITLFPPVDLEWKEGLDVDTKVQMGEKIATFMV